MPNREKDINVRSMFGHNTQRGLVMLRLGDEMTQMEPDKAAQVGRWLIEAAEAARHDEATMAVLKATDLDERTCAAVLQQIRVQRAALESED